MPQDDDNVIPFPTGAERSPRGGGDDVAGTVDGILARLRSGEFQPGEVLAAMNDLIGSRVGADPFGFQQERPRLLRAGRERRCFVVRLDLDDAKPPIWRRLRLASDLRLSQLHDVIQAAMGWTDSHLHHFQMGPDARKYRMQPFLTPFDLEEGETDGIPESDIRLDQVVGKPGHRLFYEYDFGDSWGHTIKLEEVEPWTDGDPIARCVAGRRACPPEDVGGVGGYAEALAALDGHIEPDQAEWMAQVLVWLPTGFDPAAFDLDDVNAQLVEGPFPDLDRWHPEVLNLLTRDRSRGETGLAGLVRLALVDEGALSDEGVEALTHRYRALLGTIGAGVKLTAAGYLPQAVVEGLYRELDLDDEWFGRGNREDQTLPVLTLRQSATALGLLRKANGRLNVTNAGQKLAGDPRALLDHIRGRIPIGRGFERDAGMLGLLFAAAGEESWEAQEEAAEILAALGWTTPDDSLANAFSHSYRSSRDVLDHLCGNRSSQEERAATARVLLARA